MCLTPINIKKTTCKQTLADDYSIQQCPCGRCIECRRLRVNSWFVRLNVEKSHATSAHFITLSYEDAYIPYSDNGMCSLNYRDVQKFIKRLRKADQIAEGKPIKYFACGEYGSKTHRPHYHAIMFNVNNIDNVAKTWQKGFVHVGDVSDASLFYTLKYALKRSFYDKKDDWDDRKPEKALMSKGLGIDYITPQMVKYHHEDLSRGVTMLGNKKLPLPRYYRDKIMSDAQKSARAKLMDDFLEERYEKISSPLFPQRVQKMYTDQLKKLQKTD